MRASPRALAAMHARYAIVSRWSAAMVHWGLGLVPPAGTHRPLGVAGAAARPCWRQIASAAEYAQA
jgi:hypothetical protein